MAFLICELLRQRFLPQRGGEPPKLLFRLPFFAVLQFQLERSHDVGEFRIGDLCEMAVQLREQLFEQRPRGIS
jgi:hypothetical protein